MCENVRVREVFSSSGRESSDEPHRLDTLVQPATPRGGAGWGERACKHASSSCTDVARDQPCVSSLKKRETSSALIACCAIPSFIADHRGPLLSAAAPLELLPPAVDVLRDGADVVVDAIDDEHPYPLTLKEGGGRREDGGGMTEERGGEGRGERGLTLSSIDGFRRRAAARGG